MLEETSFSQPPEHQQPQLQQQQQQQQQELEQLLNRQRQRAGYYTVDLGNDHLYRGASGVSTNNSSRDSAMLVMEEAGNGNIQAEYNARKRAHDAALKLVGRAKQLFAAKD